MLQTTVNFSITFNSLSNEDSHLEVIRLVKVLEEAGRPIDNVNCYTSNNRPEYNMPIG